MFPGRCPLSMGRKQLLVRLRVKSSEGSAQRMRGGSSFPDAHLDFDIGEVGRSLGFDPGLSELGGNIARAGPAPSRHR